MARSDCAATSLSVSNGQLCPGCLREKIRKGLPNRVALIKSVDFLPACGCVYLSVHRCWSLKHNNWSQFRPTRYRHPYLWHPYTSDRVQNRFESVALARDMSDSTRRLTWGATRWCVFFTNKLLFPPIQTTNIITITTTITTTPYSAHTISPPPPPPSPPHRTRYILLRRWWR